jgi:uncharacterized spore protein YtfJ
MTDATQEPIAGLSDAANAATHNFGRLMDVSADRIFRDPVHVGDRVVITAAAIDLAGGLGFGGGSDAEGSGGGGGGGVGGRAEGRPVAAIEIGPNGVVVKPIVDVTRLGITALLGAFAVWRAMHRR